MPIHSNESLLKLCLLEHTFLSIWYSLPFFFYHFIYDLKLQLFRSSYMIYQLIILICYLSLIKNVIFIGWYVTYLMVHMKIWILDDKKATWDYLVAQDKIRNKIIREKVTVAIIVGNIVMSYFK